MSQNSCQVHRKATNSQSVSACPHKLVSKHGMIFKQTNIYLKLYLLGSDGDKAIGFKYLYLEQTKSYKCHYKHYIMTVLLFNMAVNEIIRDQAKMS